MNLRTRRAAKRLILPLFILILVWFISNQLAVISPTWNKLKRTLGVSVLAGAITGILETLIMYPIENIKTQQQLSGGHLMEVWRRTIDHYGYLGLYRGMTPVLIGAIPTQAVRWASFEFFCHLWGCDGIKHVFVAGLVSGCFVAVLTGVPIETFKTHMIHTLFPTPASTPQAEYSGDKGSAFKGMSPVPGRSPTVAPTGAAGSPLLTPTFGTPFSPSSFAPHVAGGAGGHTGLFSIKMKGWMPTIIKKIANQSIRFPVHAAYFGLLCQFFFVVQSTAPAGHEPASATEEGHHHVSCTLAAHPFFSFTAGMGAGLTSIILTQPIDVVKTRMQGISGERYGNFLQCFRTLAREEGLIVFAHGIGARSLRVGFGAGLTFMLFPVLKEVIGGGYGAPHVATPMPTKLVH